MLKNFINLNNLEELNKYNNVNYKYDSDNVYSYCGTGNYAETADFQINTDFKINVNDCRGYNVIYRIPNQINSLIYSYDFFDNFLNVYIENHNITNKNKLKYYFKLLLDNYKICKRLMYIFKYNDYYDKKLFKFIVDNKKKIKSLKKKDDKKIFIEKEYNNINKYYIQSKKIVDDFMNNINNYYIINNFDEQFNTIEQLNLTLNNLIKKVKFNNIYEELKDNKKYFGDLFYDAIDILNEEEDEYYDENDDDDYYDNDDEEDDDENEEDGNEDDKNDDKEKQYEIKKIKKPSNKIIIDDNNSDVDNNNDNDDDGFDDEDE